MGHAALNEAADLKRRAGPPSSTGQSDHYRHRLASTCFCASIPRAKSLARCNPIQIVFGPRGPSAALLVKPPHSAIIATISLNAGGVWTYPGFVDG